MNMIYSNCTVCKAGIEVNQYEWHDKEAHICMGCNRTNNLSASLTDPDDEYSLQEGEDEFTFTDLDGEEFRYNSHPKLTKKSCECGAEKVGTPWHSRYCPVFTNPMGEDD